MLDLLAVVIQYGETLSITKELPVGEKPTNDGYWHVQIGEIHHRHPIPWIGDESIALGEAIRGAIKAYIGAVKHA